MRLKEEDFVAGNDITVSRALHDAGLAAWFGGSLAGAVGFNGAAADVDDPTQRARVANAAWARWTPVNAAAIGAHLVGGARLVQENKARVAAQSGTGAATAAKTLVTVAALGATGYSRVLGKKIQDAGDVPVAGGTDPLPTTPPEVAKAQKQLKALQWAIPALTGTLVYLTSKQGGAAARRQRRGGAGDRAARAHRLGPEGCGGRQHRQGRLTLSGTVA